MDAPENSTFSGPVASTFHALHFCDYPFTCWYNKENKEAEGFKTSHDYWLFSSDIMAVKGLSVQISIFCYGLI